MNEIASPAWPWYVAGPIVGLMVPLALLIGNRRWGVSSSLRHLCAMASPIKPAFLRYNWRSEAWSLFFVAGAVMGGFIGAHVIPNAPVPDVAPRTVAAIQSLGFESPRGLVPAEAFSFSQLATVRGFMMIVVGGFLVGFGTRYANGCTSGHSITGLALRELPSLVATIAFFIGGLIMTHVVFEWIF
ncbi:MAG TPA: YeeE/YedE thiosulfate transporter family protein [Candidatus Krumholzibacteria bacterium]|nr:YeeE/YedE thiosulfate transporter family protein [Candidatus Krumholzibacteria bacterium]